MPIAIRIVYPNTSSINNEEWRRERVVGTAKRVQRTTLKTIIFDPFWTLSLHPKHCDSPTSDSKMCRVEACGQ